MSNHIERVKYPAKSGENVYTIKSLGLNLEAAHAGRTWELLPRGFRASEDGTVYPLPCRTKELQKIVCIPIIPRKRDCGSKYIRRAIREWHKRHGRKVPIPTREIALRGAQIAKQHENFNFMTKNLRADARQAVEEVRAEAAKAVASLTDLFSLGRKGLDGQMRAHLEQKEWNGEMIDAKAFRDCFRMVTNAVKGLGLPSDQKAPASEAIMEELAAAIRSTQESIDYKPVIQETQPDESKN